MKDTQWHPVISLGQPGKLCRAIPCQGVILKGRLVHRSYEDNNGNKKYITAVVVTEVMAISPKMEKA